MYQGFCIRTKTCSCSNMERCPRFHRSGNRTDRQLKNTHSMISIPSSSKASIKWRLHHLRDRHCTTGSRTRCRPPTTVCCCSKLDHWDQSKSRETCKPRSSLHNKNMSSFHFFRFMHKLWIQDWNQISWDSSIVRAIASAAFSELQNASASVKVRRVFSELNTRLWFSMLHLNEAFWRR